MTSYSELDERT